MEINYEQDSAEAQVPEESALATLNDLVRLQIQLEDLVETLSTELKETSDRLKNLSDVIIPDRITALGLKQLKLDDGTVIEVLPWYSASIKEEVQDKAFRWLRRHGFGDIIKHEYVTNFKMGEDKLAKRLRAYLLRYKYTFNDIERVHPQTLKKFVKEQCSANEDGKFPKDLFGVFEGKHTKITRIKEKKNG